MKSNKNTKNTKNSPYHKNIFGFWTKFPIFGQAIIGNKKRSKNEPKRAAIFHIDIIVRILHNNNQKSKNLK